jgi:nucleoside-triphosphatase THEP1
VNIEELEEFGCQAILRSIKEKKIIVVDEIGKMELYSCSFRETLLKGLDSSCKVLATIMERPNAFTDRVKKRPDVELLHLKRETAERILAYVRKWAKLL